MPERVLAMRALRFLPSVPRSSEFYPGFLVSHGHAPKKLHAMRRIRRFTALLLTIAMFVTLPGMPAAQNVPDDSGATNVFQDIPRPGSGRTIEDPADPAFTLYEQERRLIFLPLLNDTRDETIDYLSEGIIKILGGKVEGVGYVRPEDPGRLFVVTPLKGGEAERPRENLRFTRENNSALPPGEWQRVLLDVEVRQLDDETNAASLRSRPDQRAADLKADYLVSGSYRYAAGGGVSRDGGITRRGPIIVRIEMYNAVTGKSANFEFQTDIQFAYRNLDDPSNRIRNFVSGGETAPVQVSTPEPGAMVYLDDLYLGRTPVDARALPGEYELRVEQDGYQTVRETAVISSGERNVFTVRAPREDHRAALNVTTDVEGASVFLNYELIGETPLQRDDLPPGVHRLRIVKEGYVDRFVGVILKNGESRDVDVEMQEGHTETFYKDPNYAVLDWNYYDLGFYSAIGSLVFYGGWIHFQIRADRIRDRIRTELPFLSIFSITNLFSAQGVPLLLYQQSVIEQNESRANAEFRKANISAGLGIASLLAASFFVIRGLVLDERKEVGEISWFFRDAPREDRRSVMYAAGSPVIIESGNPDTKRNGTRTDEQFYEAGLQLRF